MNSVNIIDLSAAILIVVVAVLGAKKGFFKVLVRCISYVASVFIARMTASPLSQLLYANLFKQKTTDYIGSVLPDGNKIVMTISQLLPEKVALIADFFHLLPSDETANHINAVLSPEKIESTYIMPVVTKIILIVTTVILFIIFSFIFRIVSGSINNALFKKKKNPAATMNAVLGFLFGAVKAVIPILIFCICCNLLAPLFGQNHFTDLVDRSVLCNFVAGLF